MSKKPVNFYQGAKGTYRIDIIETEGGTKATHAFNEIKQAIEDGFLPYCVTDDGVDREYHLLDMYSDDDDGQYFVFNSELEYIEISNSNNVTITQKDSGGSGEYSTIKVAYTLERPANFPLTLAPNETYLFNLNPSITPPNEYLIYSITHFVDNIDGAKISFLSIENKRVRLKNITSENITISSLVGVTVTVVYLVEG